MVHKPTIDWLNEKLGGGFYQHKSNQKRARTSWSFELKGARTYFLLKRLIPHMKTKRAEADIALALGQSLFIPLVRGKLMPETIAWRAKLGQTLRDLKRYEWLE